MRTSTRALPPALVVVLALLAGGCGDDGPRPATSGATPPPAAVTPADEPESAVDDPATADGDATTAAPSAPVDVTGTVVGVIEADPELSTFAAALAAVGLAETLAGTGPYTVLAPTDAAFARALDDLGLTREALLASPDLAAIVARHLLQGAVAADDLAGRPTVQGTPLRTGEATVVRDVAATNGIVHVVDAVLVPPGLPG